MAVLYWSRVTGSDHYLDCDILNISWLISLSFRTPYIYVVLSVYSVQHIYPCLAGPCF